MNLLAPGRPRADAVGDRAVIDIGSNTVRLVVCGGSRRSPEVWLNERVSAKLGRDLAATGAMPDKAVAAALAALARYAAIVEDLGIVDVQTVATAAVRDASNGAAFLGAVGALGLSPRLLSGEEEAFGAAYGVIGAFPGARGMVADLGGGSLELVTIEQATCHHGVSLPLGTLRLAPLRAQGDEAFAKAVRKHIAATGLPASSADPLYMVGGTWRALAVYAMREADFPLSDPHGFRLTAGEAAALAARVAATEPARLAAVQGVSNARAAGLPDAAALLGIILDRLRPECVVFSSWGLREGLLFQKLPPDLRGQDPLLAAVGHFAEPRGGPPGQAAMIAAWTADAIPAETSESGERLRLAATMLALAAAHVEPNMRARHAYGWAMDKRWVGLDPEGRAQLATALLAGGGKSAPLPELERLASPEMLREAHGWGLAIRLCRRLGAGSRVSLLTSRIYHEPGELVLWLHPTRAQLASDQVRNDLKALARWLGAEPRVAIGTTADVAAE